jgi:cellulose 1,4-beta-cellobiosidase
MSRLSTACALVFPLAAIASSAAASPSVSELPPPQGEVPKHVPDLVAPNPDANPFAGAGFAIDSSYVAKVESSVRASPADSALLKKVEAFPTAVWLDSIESTVRVGNVLDEARAQEKRAGKPLAAVFVIYNLPDRDCSSTASAGQLSSRTDGETRYRKDFIDPIAREFKAHPKQRVAVIVEPDSLANLATNLNKGTCAAAEPVYKHSIAYAIRQFAMPNVATYLDAAHAGWLGWSGNRAKITQIFSDVLAEAGGADKVRGFAVNVANYDSLQDGDLPRLEPSDPATGELKYIDLLNRSLTEAGITGKAFVVDTSRNGRSGIRTKSGSWCNVAGAGLGERPQANPTPFVDAYLWIKPPGESDGGSDPNQDGFDEMCGARSPDAAPNAPHAGSWFHSYFVDLAKKANPPL